MLVLFFFNATATPEIYTLSLHDALPIYLGDGGLPGARQRHHPGEVGRPREKLRDRGDEVGRGRPTDRKSTRLNSSHEWISYAVFCLKKKKKKKKKKKNKKRRIKY